MNICLVYQGNLHNIKNYLYIVAFCKSVWHDNPLVKKRLRKKLRQACRQMVTMSHIPLYLYLFIFNVFKWRLKLAFQCIVCLWGKGRRGKGGKVPTFTDPAVVGSDLYAGSDTNWLVCKKCKWNWDFWWRSSFWDLNVLD